ncbi:hypothetical protein K493DRAFT_53598 [Basidiobolus meristosporus CBS 931.73]|uniref:Ubiquitin-like protease family profile domain-containing protein n=1 Tax=Basidiobolus meristosporus CBS 931.73 TaxID=1314790 RepID=A0A1Y1XZG9_9FUNG|nr:hypothetical protein K493DRAFT_53598 [Basidiobolus meristosporus CBS 931.73]|eukprot:ORX91131.1 hypothetical protein K493DRAFT_53598 [Basidiobolus meristosporus CBS 931.73]
MPWVFIFDSMPKRSYTKLCNQLEEYLRTEARLRYAREPHNKISRRTVATPKQMNFVDCGVHLLCYAQTFLKDPSRFYSICQAQKSDPNVWPGPAEALALRKNIGEVILATAKEYAQ